MRFDWTRKLKANPSDSQRGNSSATIPLSHGSDWNNSCCAHSKRTERGNAPASSQAVERGRSCSSIKMRTFCRNCSFSAEEKSVIIHNSCGRRHDPTERVDHVLYSFQPPQIIFFNLDVKCVFE